MATGHLRLLGVASLVAGGGLAIWSCNLGEGYVDFGNDLTNQEMVIVDGPGGKIADGPLSGMLVDPWGDKGAIVVGFRYLEGEPYLRMQPFDGRAGCNVGRAYRCIVFNRLPNEPQLIAYLDDIDGNRGTLYFTDHQCQIAYGPFPNAVLPSRLFDSPPGFIVDNGPQLLDVDPYNKRTRVIAEDLRFWSGPGDSSGRTPVWYVAGGQLVVLDDSRKELLRLGTSVTEVVFQSADPTRGLFLVDGGALAWYQQTTGAAPKIIANDVCQASLGGYGISYYTPCSGDAKLVIQDPTTGQVFPIDSGVNQLLYAQQRTIPGTTTIDVEAVYTKTSTSDSNYNDLWLRQVGTEPRIWQRRLGRFISASTGPNPSLLAIVDADNGAGRFMRVDSTGEKTLAEGVSLSYPLEAVAGGWLYLTQVAAGVGTLVWLGESGEQRTIIDRYPLDIIAKAPMADPNFNGVKYAEYFGLRGLQLDSETGVGPVTLFDRNTLNLSPLANQVGEGRFDFFRNMSAVAYLDAYDPTTGAGTLNVYQTHVGALSTVSTNVVDYAELLWPYEGVIYTVKQGENYSLWAARAKP